MFKGPILCDIASSRGTTGAKAVQPCSFDNALGSVSPSSPGCKNRDKQPISCAPTLVPGRRLRKPGNVPPLTSKLWKTAETSQKSRLMGNCPRVSPTNQTAVSIRGIRHPIDGFAYRTRTARPATGCLNHPSGWPGS